MPENKPETKQLVVQLPLGAGTVPLRPVDPKEAASSLVSRAATPYGSPANSGSQFAFQSFVFKY